MQKNFSPGYELTIYGSPLNDSCGSQKNTSSKKNVVPASAFVSVLAGSYFYIINCQNCLKQPSVTGRRYDDQRDQYNTRRNCYPANCADPFFPGCQVAGNGQIGILF